MSDAGKERSAVPRRALAVGEHRSQRCVDCLIFVGEIPARAIAMIHYY
jgi:hypothetical protein